MRKRSVLWCVGLTAALALTACGRPAEEAMEPEATATPAIDATPAPRMAAAQLSGPAGVSGVVNFTEVPGGIQVVTRVEGASPGQHGLHVHEVGACDGPDFQSAGGHFNPTGAPHAGPMATPRHAGDLGNIEIAADGTGSADLTTDLLTLDEGANSVLGKSVIVHAGADDLTTQPTGDSGSRVACGLVERVEGEVDSGTLEPAVTPTAAPEAAI
jgi:Cu-Zn family superoxide dismutase